MTKRFISKTQKEANCSINLNYYLNNIRLVKHQTQHPLASHKNLDMLIELFDIISISPILNICSNQQIEYKKEQQPGKKSYYKHSS